MAAIFFCSSSNVKGQLSPPWTRLVLCDSGARVPRRGSIVAIHHATVLHTGGYCACVGGHRGREGDKWGRKDGCRRHRRSDRKRPLLLNFLLGRAGRVTGRTSAAQARLFGRVGGSGVFTRQKISGYNRWQKFQNECLDKTFHIWPWDCCAVVSGLRS